MTLNHEDFALDYSQSKKHPARAIRSDPRYDWTRYGSRTTSPDRTGQRERSARAGHDVSLC